MLSEHIEPFDNVFLLTPRRFRDDRGYFCETWHQVNFEKTIGRSVEFVQDCHSLSRQSNTLRGLHAQKEPNAQEKLVTVYSGAIWDFIVDARPESPTLGKWAKAMLSEENGRQLFIPAGFLHGFVTLHENTKIHYKIAGRYSVEDAVTVNCFDTALGLDLGSGPFIQSQKDLCGISWQDFLAFL